MNIITECLFLKPNTTNLRNKKMFSKYVYVMDNIESTTKIFFNIIVPTESSSIEIQLYINNIFQNVLGKIQ